MKIQYMSDLHLEFGDMPVPDVQADTLVLAGDIHTGVNAIQWIEECSWKFKNVIYILGNHEYYNNKMWKLPTQIQDAVDGSGLFDPLPNVHFLDNSCIEIDRVNFIGSTLWCVPDESLQWRMNDYSKIQFKYPTGYGKFSVEEARLLHIKGKNFLQRAIRPEMRNVIITHHAPSHKMNNYLRYGNDSIMYTGYATDIIEEFNSDNISAWISGHTHAAHSKIINNIPCISNCRGYAGFEENPEFDPNAYIEI